MLTEIDYADLPLLVECLTCEGSGGWPTGSYCYTLMEHEGWEDCPDCGGTGTVLDD